MDINQLNDEDLYFKAKYIKYKSKYLALKQQKGGMWGIEKAWNSSVQFVQENVIEKPVNYVTQVTQQITPQERTPEQKIEDQLNQEIAVLEQQLNEQKKIVQETRPGTSQYNEEMKKQMNIDKELSPKKKELRTIKTNQENLKRAEAERLRKYIEEEERKKKQEEKNIIATINTHNNNIIDLLHRLITKDTKIFTDYIFPINPGSCNNKGKHLLNIYDYNYYSFANLNKMLKKNVNLFSDKTERENLIIEIIKYIYNSVRGNYKIINKTTQQREDLNKTNIQDLINYLNTIIEKYIENPTAFFRNPDYLYLYSKYNVCR